MFMVERTYHLSIDGMMVFLRGLEDIMEPYETHCNRFLQLIEKMNEKCFEVSTTGIQTTMQSVAMFPDLRNACAKTMSGFADLAEIQAQVCETASDINNDIARMQKGYIALLKTLIEPCESAD